MTAEQARKLEDFKKELHISASQVSRYLHCSLSYYFAYVEGRKPEQKPAALLFGRAVHAVIARYYETFKDTGHPESLSLLQELFEDHWKWNIKDSGVRVTYKKGSDKESMLTDGQRLVQTFYRNVKPMEVVAIEEPLSALLHDEEGNPTEFKLIGIVDCIQRDENDNLIIIDHKTASRTYTEEKVAQSMQMTVYSYLVCANKMVPVKSETVHRFDVLVKLKKEPRLDLHYTTRTAADRRRLAKVTNRVLKGIEECVFFPNPGWMCSDCQWSRACAEWSV